MSVLIGNKVSRTLVMAVFLVGITLGVALAGQQGQVYQVGNVTVYTAASQDIEGAGTIDFENAKPMPLPMALSAPQILRGGAAAMPLGAPGFKPGSRGNSTSPRDTAVGNEAQAWGPAIPQGMAVGVETQAGGIPVPQEYGTSDHPFTTSRVDLATNNSVSKLYPYRAAGKLFFNKPDGSAWLCSASLIQPGLIVTAAHCVCDFGTQTFYSNWQFIPAYYNGARPYGIWKVADAVVKTSYWDGTDSCAQSGVVCTNDVAVLLVQPLGKAGPNNKSYPGYRTGWLGYGWDGYGFSSPSSGPASGYTIAQIGQLGYPVSHDRGWMMQRTDSLGYVSAPDSNNTVWGSRQTGGSSGGPEIVNLGAPAVLDPNQTNFGSGADFNIVVGVTSWGYTDPTIMQQGASSFTSNNIVSLVDYFCPSTTYAYACAP